MREKPDHERRRVDYRAISAKYVQDLDDVLRGFSADDPILALWVYDGDINESILNLVESASAVGALSLRIDLADDDADRVELARIANGVGKGARTTLEQGAEGRHLLVDVPVGFQRRRAQTVGGRASGNEIEIDDVKAVPRAPNTLPATYRVEGKTPASSTPDSGSGRSFRSVTDLVELNVSVDDDGRVVAATFTERPNAGFAPRDTATLRVIESRLRERGVRDVRNNVVIEVETMLRDDGKPPVAGIVLPWNAARVFATAAAACAQLGDQMLAAFGTIDETVPVMPTVSQTWKSKSSAQQTDLIVAELSKHISAHRFSVLRVVDGFRVFLTVDASVAPMVLADALLEAERRLRHDVEPAIELFLEARRDENVKRLPVMQSLAQGTEAEDV